MDYGLQDAAHRLRISEKTLRRWVHQGKIEHTIDHGRYLIPERALIEIEARKAAASDTTLVDRIEAVETQINALSDRLSEMEKILKEKYPAPAPYETRPAPPRKTRLIHNGGQLPDGLVGWRQFADLHNIAQSTVQRAIESGRLDIVRGHWKQGRAWVEMALDAAGRQHFYELFSATNPGFKRCGKCPHNV